MTKKLRVRATLQKFEEDVCLTILPKKDTLGFSLSAEFRDAITSLPYRQRRKALLILCEFANKADQMVERVSGQKFTSIDQDKHLASILNVLDASKGDFVSMQDRDNRHVDAAEIARRLAYGYPA